MWLIDWDGGVYGQKATDLPNYLVLSFRYELTNSQPELTRFEIFQAFSLSDIAVSIAVANTTE